jgi:predicted AlkP superfamily pyrophosphatase or phosphodiesterase
MLKRFAAILLSATIPVTAVPMARADAYNAHPKLVVVLVIDQFRADYLERYRADFKDKGFRLFLDHGAWFPDCYYEYANLKTAPGHSAMSTGAYTDGNGISANAWWDLARNKKQPVSSVEDERYAIVSATPASAAAAESAAQGTSNTPPATAAATPTGTAGTPPPAPATAAPTAPAQAGASPAQEAQPGTAPGEPGASPRNLIASTLGDELRLATQGQSRLYGVSLKDRAAILTSGHAANGAFWIDQKSGRFVSSSYYMTALPQWVDDFDNGPAIQQAASDAGVTSLTNFYDQVGATNAGNQYEIAFAEALIKNESLGNHATTDMLTLSLSPNDIEGHQYGPDSPQERAMVDGLDVDLNSFFNWIDKNVPGGLDNVVLALTADHGIAPTPAVSSGLGLPGTYIDVHKLVTDLNQAMNAKFSPGENDEYLFQDQDLPYLSLNQPMFERAGINEQEAEDAVKVALPHAFAELAAKPGAMLKAAPPAAPPITATAPASTPDATGQASAASGTPPSSKTSTAKTAAIATNGTTPAVDTTPPAPPPARYQPDPQLFRSYTRVELAAGTVPPTALGQMMARSYSPNGGWYVAAFPIAFQMGGSERDGGTTHFSPFAYDRHVPLAFYGAPFAPGIYRGHAEPVDLAVTLASILGINMPSAAIGQVLTQALKPAGDYPYPKEPSKLRHPHIGEHLRREEQRLHHPGAPATPSTETPQQ